MKALDLAAPPGPLDAVVANVDAVIHLAARAHLPGEDTSKEAYFAINAAATERLAHAAQRAGVRRFVFASTAKVYGECSGRDAFVESATPRPVGPYAESKWKAEQTLHRIAQESGLEVVILRAPLIYGEGVKGNLLQLVGAIAARRPLPLAGIANRRSLLGVENFADAMLCCLRDARAAGETFNVCDPVPVSTTDLACEIAAAMETRPRLWSVPLPLLSAAARLAGRREAVERLTADLVLDGSKIARTLQWEAPVPRSHGIAHMVRWYANSAVEQHRPRK